jgi:hypothetical protein
LVNLKVSDNSSQIERNQLYQNNYVLSAFGELHTKEPIENEVEFDELERVKVSVELKELGLISVMPMVEYFLMSSLDLLFRRQQKLKDLAQL